MVGSGGLLSGIRSLNVGGAGGGPGVW
jgi:hypothetical protein